MSKSREQQLREQFESVLKRLTEVLSHSLEETDFVLDASIQRFEFCFELCWKWLKQLLREKEGIEAKSPKQVFRNAYQLEWINDEVLWLKMLEDRNLMSHTYRELDALQVYQNLPPYAQAFNQLIHTQKNL